MEKITRPHSRQQHAEITEYLQNLIKSGELAPGDTLPSEAELCEKFKTSRGPVRQAMAALRAEGLVSSGRGRRSMVLASRASNSFDALISSTFFIEEEGHTAGERILRIAREPATGSIAQALAIAENDPVVEIVRVRTANDVPVILERLVFPNKYGERFLTLVPESPSVHRQLLEHGIEVDNVVREAYVSQADSGQATLLGIEEGAPVVNVTLRASTYQGEPVEYAEHSLRGDKFTFNFSNVRGGSVPVKFDLRP